MPERSRAISGLIFREEFAPSSHRPAGSQGQSSDLQNAMDTGNRPENVIDRFRQGDANAFEDLFRRHQRAIYGWILRIVRDPPAAEDLTVETFWRIHTNRERFDPARPFEPWARRIATRAALDWLRARKPEVELDETAVALPASTAIDPGVAAEIRSKTANAFARLPPRLRVAATLVLVEECPHKEAAEALGITVTAVKLRVFRAIRLLRKDLERQGITP